MSRGAEHDACMLSTNDKEALCAKKQALLHELRAAKAATAPRPIKLRLRLSFFIATEATDRSFAKSKSGAVAATSLIFCLLSTHFCRSFSSTSWLQEGSAKCSASAMTMAVACASLS